MTAGNERFEAENVVVAMANYQIPRCLRLLATSILELSSCTPMSTETPHNCRRAEC